MALRLGELLVINNFIKKEQLAEALKMQKQTGKKIGSILVGLGFISEDVLLKFLTDKFEVSTVDLSNLHVGENILNLLPAAFCIENSVMPIDKYANNISVVMLDPLNDDTKEKIKSITGLNVDPLVTSEHSLNEALNKYYPPSMGNIDVQTKIDSAANVTPMDEIDTILGFNNSTNIPIKEQAVNKPQQQAKSTFLDQDVISPEIEKLRKQNTLLNQKIEELRQDTTQLVTDFSTVKEEIQKRLSVIAAYYKKLKPVEGTYDQFITGMKDFYQKYQDTLTELKTVKNDITVEKSEVAGIKDQFENSKQNFNSMKEEYRDMISSIEDEKKKINKGLRDKTLKKFIHSKIFEETYGGEDYDIIKEKAKKFYKSSILIRNIFMILIILTLALNIFLVSRGGFNLGGQAAPTKKTTIEKEKPKKQLGKKTEEEKQAELEAEKKAEAEQTELEAEKKAETEQTELEAEEKAEEEKQTELAAEKKAEADRQARLEAEKKRKAEADRQAREAEKKRKAEADRRARLEAEKKRKATAKPQVYRIKVLSGGKEDIDIMKTEFESYGIGKLYIINRSGTYVLYSGPYKTYDNAKAIADTLIDFGVEPNIFKAKD